MVTSLTPYETDSEAVAQVLRKNATMDEQQLEEEAIYLEQQWAEEERELQEAAKPKLLAAEEVAVELKQKRRESS